VIVFKHQGLRKQLVSIIREKGIKDEKVLNAIGKVPRHLFLDPAFLSYAYKDIPFQMEQDKPSHNPLQLLIKPRCLIFKKETRF